MNNYTLAYLTNVKPQRHTIVLSPERRSSSSLAEMLLVVGPFPIVLLPRRRVTLRMRVIVVY